MLILKSNKDVVNQLDRLKKKGNKIGFVPTMGALHKGHLSLIRKSKRENDLTVCSIFVNPTQFNDKKDFEMYPSTIDVDIEMLTFAKCDILFLPTVTEMYPKGFNNSNKLDFGFLAQTLEGEFRPGHFDGMAQIVEKLLITVAPDKLYMGQKDFQQAMIVHQLIKSRTLEAELKLCPIIREKDGLAMSSRNIRLGADGRKNALELSKTLKYLKRLIKANTGQNAREIMGRGLNRLSKFPEIKVEYVAWRKSATLKPFNKYEQVNETVILIAAYVNGVRLIDNIII